MKAKAQTTVTINNEALAKALGVKAGAEKSIPVCKNGVPLDRYWRNRFKDSKVDNAITIHNNVAKVAKKPKGEGDK